MAYATFIDMPSSYYISDLNSCGYCPLAHFTQAILTSQLFLKYAKQSSANSYSSAWNAVPQEVCIAKTLSPPSNYFSIITSVTTF